MMRSNVFLVFIFAIVTAQALASEVDIPQVPANAIEQSNKEQSIKPVANPAERPDFQNDILSNPTISAPARANAVIDANGFDGSNTAVVTQTGNNNTSSVTQTGKDNTAKQTQTGITNDLRLEQHGAHNHSDEEQIGNYNHKIKIQNGDSKEETTIDSLDPHVNDTDRKY